MLPVRGGQISINTTPKKAITKLDNKAIIKRVLRIEIKLHLF